MQKELKCKIKTQIRFIELAPEFEKRKRKGTTKEHMENTVQKEREEVDWRSWKQDPAPVASRQEWK